MTTRLLAALQWIGLLAGAAIWASQLVLGYGVTEAECSPGGAGWGIANDAWQASLMGAAAGCVLGAEAAAIAVLVRTRAASYDDDGPPVGRIRFFAIAAIAANAVFLMIVLLSGAASIADVVCRQS